MDIRKGDSVQIMVGKDRGKTGKVTAVHPEKDTIVVEGLNVFKKHRRPRKQGEKGEIINVNRPLRAANALVYCGHCKRGVRVGHRRNAEKVSRICRSCETTL